nr:hypothetical protein [Micromonospora sp. DSM 115978]
PFVVSPRQVARGRRLLDADTGALDFSPASGDLLVLGGRAQADYLHAVPRVPGLLGGRISVQWRWTSRTGRPEQDPGYGAPRVFTSGR